MFITQRTRTILPTDISRSYEVARDLTPNIESLSKNMAQFQEIRFLIMRLSQLEGVDKVKAVLQIPGDIHGIIFQIKLSDTFKTKVSDEDNVDCSLLVEKSQRIWEVAQNLVLKTRRVLRDDTGEKWYFQTQLVDDFDEQGLSFTQVVIS